LTAANYSCRVACMKTIFPQKIDDALHIVEQSFKEFEKANTEDEDRFVSILISNPGVGKSAGLKKMAKRLGYELISLNLAAIEPTDIIGLGAREKVDGKWVTMPAIPKWGEKALNGKCIILVDEFNNCGHDVLAGFQTMFSDFTIDGKELPKTTHIVGACNPPGKNALFAAKKLSGAFRRRLCFIPVVDDFQYVANKHQFQMPRDFMQSDYEDIANYVEYDGLSSAVVDNIYNIVKYKSLKDREKVVLINGFGEKAFEFAKHMNLLKEEAFQADVALTDGNITYADWKRNPLNVVSEYQQILWGQESIANSCSYSRSKKFVSKIENQKVYVAILDLLKNKFEVEYETDQTKLPESRII